MFFFFFFFFFSSRRRHTRSTRDWSSDVCSSDLCGATFIVRGIRALSDFEFEFEMANMNRSLAPEIEMVYLVTAPEFLFISASRVKELAAFGAPIDKYVPANVAKRMKAMGKRGMRTGATEAKD